MSKVIVLLTQDTNDESVKMLESSLITNELNNQFDIVVLQIDEIQTVIIENRSLTLINRNQDQECTIDEVSIPIADLALVIKRTWGAIGNEALQICQQLEAMNVSILNGSEFIQWSHSKLKQFDTLNKTGALPTTLRFKNDSKNHLNAVIKKVESDLGYPVVFKPSGGCQARGIFLIENSVALKIFLNVQFELFKKRVKHGFLLQKLIVTTPDDKLSRYYRVNIINGKIQSTVQFEGDWARSDKFKEDGIYSLNFKRVNNNKPVSLQPLHYSLQKLIELCPYSNDLAGVDFVVSIHNNQIYLLEFNTGPAISLIVELGKKFILNENELGSAQACIDFPNEIASFCLRKALTCANKTFPRLNDMSPSMLIEYSFHKQFADQAWIKQLDDIFTLSKSPDKYAIVPYHRQNQA